jgi:hypothetical protein
VIRSVLRWGVKAFEKTTSRYQFTIIERLGDYLPIESPARASLRIGGCILCAPNLKKLHK